MNTTLQYCRRLGERPLNSLTCGQTSLVLLKEGTEGN